MTAELSQDETRAGITAMLSSWSGVPALLCDRHLTVLASNAAARALSPGFAEGVNLARFTFLEPEVNRDHDMYDAAANQVAALLRESLDEHHGDAAFRAIVGDLSVLSLDFAAAWADESLSARASGVIDFADTPVGLIQMGYQVLRVPGSEDDSLLVWGPADEASANALARLLASA
ncbi:MmyB family transcriptional regulator [Herbiconiux daphne]|uniref:MmyB-like transcription regulator ligand binding domain-containing protein n=1 Tax=Herbiconiux daphne TaxID=2970914 RepID=A0ABT2H0B6_9MICO|nr:hypothetical protein [Herbiconiux daphne]MCS5732779.1 hypothetical protein [Herbiconiux daphne]